VRPITGASPSASEVAPLGFITGLSSEARLLRGLGVIGVGLEEIHRVAQSGVRGLVSFGYAGGLDPALPAGTLIIPRLVIDERGNRFPADPALTRSLGGASAEILLTMRRIVMAGEEKRRLFQRTRAAAIDMESAEVARLAQAFDLPFAALRVVLDPAHRDLPAFVGEAVDDRGGLKWGWLLGHFLRHPGDFFALIPLGREHRRARRALLRRLRELRRGRLSGISDPA
jgi:adenosylhomocysteine nucleosidase